MTRRPLALFATLLLTACPAVEGKVGDDTGVDDDASDASDDDDDDDGDDDDDDDDDDGYEDDDDCEDDEDEALAAPSRWSEYRLVEIDYGCTVEVWGLGFEVSAGRPDLVALCPECEYIFEIRTDIETACDESTAVQVVNPYYRGISGWGGDTLDVWFGTQPPYYEDAGFSFLTEGAFDRDTRELVYEYGGDLGVEDGTYTIEAIATIE